MKCAQIFNFRICLRVQTVNDSRDILNRPEAAKLPSNLPGRAYFQVGDGGMPRQFQTARVGIEYSDNKINESKVIDDPIYQVDLDLEDPVMIYQPPKPAKKSNTQTDIPKKPRVHEKLVKEMQLIYDEMVSQHYVQPMEQILLDPLPPELSLRTFFEDAIELNDNENEGERRIAWVKKSPFGWNGQDWQPISEADDYRIIIGKLDDLAKHQQPPLYIDLYGKHGGHLLVFGAPGSGKTMFLRTFVYSVAYQFPPSLIHIYILSFAGRSLEPLNASPMLVM